MKKIKSSEYISVAEVSDELSIPVDQFSARFGIYVIEKGTDQSSVGLEIKSDYKNPLGAVHGGLITTLIDMAAGVAANSEGDVATTLNMTTHFIKAATESKILEATATVMHSGRTTSVYNVTVTDERDRLIAGATVTYFKFGRKWSDQVVTDS